MNEKNQVESVVDDQSALVEQAMGLPVLTPEKRRAGWESLAKANREGIIKACTEMGSRRD